MKRVQLRLKYTFDCMPKDLYLALTKPSFLQNWIAETVEYDNQTQVYTFGWGASQESAHIVESVENHFIKWAWVGKPELGEEHVSFLIEQSPEDGLVDLHIEDFCDENEQRSLREGWEDQMRRLEGLLG